MTIRERLYDVAVHASRPLLGLAGLGSPKAGRAVAGRRTSAASLDEWAREGRDPGRPLLWIHGSSAGELAGLGPVLDRLRAGVGSASERGGDEGLQLAVTYSSPSAEGTATRLRPHVADFVPLDTLRDTRRAVRALSPAALIFAKTDVWPGLTASARREGVPLGLLNATVDEGSSRLQASARFLLAPAYRRLDAVGAATEEDARRLRRLGVEPDRIRVTGDAALDAALERSREAAGSPGRRRLERWRPASVPLLLAGSTWPADEEMLLSAVAELRRGGRPVALALVPHEPDPAHVERLVARCREFLGISPRLWSEMEEGSPGETGTGGDGAREEDAGPGGHPLVVDTVGVLAELYGAADVAFVGGGLGDDGLHSVVEPAAAGVPVTFGPRYDRWEARRLLRRGAARELDPRSAAGVLGEILFDDSRRQEMGQAARIFVEEGAGAADAGAALVRELLGGDGGRQ